MANDGREESNDSDVKGKEKYEDKVENMGEGAGGNTC